MNENCYRTMISKPPDGIENWPLCVVVEFKEAVYEANLALNRLMFSEWGKGRLKQMFVEKAERVHGFYRLRGEIEERRQSC